MNYPKIQSNELSYLVSYYMTIDNSSKENALWKSLRIYYGIKPALIAQERDFNLSSIYNIEHGTKASIIKWTSFKLKMLEVYSLTKKNFLQIYEELFFIEHLNEEQILCVSRLLGLNSFSCLVYYIRSIKTQSQLDIATKLKVSRQYYQMMESGKRPWKPEIINRLCNLLKMDYFRSKIVTTTLLQLNTKRLK